MRSLKIAAALICAGAAAWGVGAQAQDAVPSADQVKQWIQQLGSDSLDERETAYRKLRGMGEDARPSLEQAAQQADDIDVRFGARRLLEALSGEDPFANLRRPQQGAPRTPAPFPRHPLLRRQQDPSFDQWNRDLQQWQQEMEAWQRDLDLWLRGMLEGHGLGVQPQDPGRFESSRGSSTSVQIDEDGHVKVHVTRTEDGETHEEVYEADSIEAFRAEHPELAQELGLGGSGPWSFQFRVPQRGLPRDLGPGAGLGSEGPRLGVHVQPLSPEQPHETSGRSLEQGLLVMDVVPDTLAQRLGIRPGDVVTKVAGKDVASPEDVRDALEAAGNTPVKVTVVRAGQDKVLEESLRG